MEIIALQAFYERNDAIIKIVNDAIFRDNERILEFLSALHFTNQNHIVNRIDYNESEIYFVFSNKFVIIP